MPTCIISISGGPNVDQPRELRYQQVRAVERLARDSGIPFSAELMKRATFIDMARTGDGIRQIVNLEVDLPANQDAAVADL